MGYITMPHACFLAGTTKNPIKRAIAKREIYAHKDNLGRWQISEKTFLHWLSTRRAAGNFPRKHDFRPVDRQCTGGDVDPISSQAEVSKLISDKLNELDAEECKAWRRAALVQPNNRADYLKLLFFIVDQKQVLQTLRAAVQT